MKKMWKIIAGLAMLLLVFHFLTDWLFVSSMDKAKSKAQQACDLAVPGTSILELEKSLADNGITTTLSPKPNSEKVEYYNLTYLHGGFSSEYCKVFVSKNRVTHSVTSMVEDAKKRAMK